MIAEFDRLFTELMLQLRKSPALDSRAVRLIREFGDACYALGTTAASERPTVPAAPRSPGAYMVVKPGKDDKL